MDGSLLFILASLAAQGAPANAAPAAAAQRNPADVRICRSYGAATGSRMGSRRICKTQSEWAIMERDTRETMDRVQRPAVKNQ